MKCYIVITLIFSFGLFITSRTEAQESREGFKGANTIIITSIENDSITYEKVARALIDAGFSIDVNNKEYFQLRTGLRTVPCVGCDQYTLSARVKQGRIFVTANIQGNFGGGYSWSFTKSKAIKDYSVHEEIIKVLSSLGQVSYSKQ